MITVNNINGVPETIPDPHPGFGSHSDDEFFYFFESVQEAIDFYLDLE